MFFRRSNKRTTKTLDNIANLSALISSEVYKKPSERKAEINGYKLDRDIESDQVVIYFNDNIKDVIMGIRGTKTASDLYSDFLLGLNQLTNINKFFSSDRFVSIRKKLENVINKFDRLGYNIRLTGHSLAGFETIKLSQKYDAVDSGVAFNAGSVPLQIRSDKIPDNVEHYRNPRDIISYGWRNDPQTIEYINKDKMSLWNPLTNHTINYFK